MSDRLTAKQEKFIQNILSGMTQRQAYRNAYNAEKMKDETVDVRACELFKQGKIRVRYDELIAQANEKAIMSAQERMKWFSEIIADKQTEPDGTTADLNTKMRAADLLAKLRNEYTTKIDADVNNDVTINIELSDE